MEMKFVNVEGHDTRCIVAGEVGAPPFILVHGLSLTADLWMKNIDSLGRHFRVAALDMLGHGFTRPKDMSVRITFDDKVSHILKFAEIMGFDRFAISGSSYGGLVAANVYLAAKKRVEKLVINGSGSAFNTEDQLAAFLERIYDNYGAILKRPSPDGWRKVLEGTFHDPLTIPSEIPMLLSLCYAQPWAVDCWNNTIDEMRALEAFRRFRILERLEEIDVETLVVWGRNDTGGIYEAAVAAVDQMPDSTLVSIEGCGHLPMIEKPEIYNQEVSKFLL